MDDMPNSPPEDFADDLLEGAEQIALFLYKNPEKRKRVYYLAESARGANKLPTFRMGGIICARKSTLRRWVAECEKAAA